MILATANRIENIKADAENVICFFSEKMDVKQYEIRNDNRFFTVN